MTIEILQLLFDKVVDVPGVQVVVIDVPAAGFSGRRLFCRGAEAVKQIIETSQFLLHKVVDVPVLLVLRVPQVPSWRRHSCSHSCTC